MTNILTDVLEIQKKEMLGVIQGKMQKKDHRCQSLREEFIQNVKGQIIFN